MRLLRDFIARYEYDLEGFVREALRADEYEWEMLDGTKGRGPYPWQVRVAKWYDARDPLISIRSGHGVGKTAFFAWTMVHHQVCKFPQKTACTAPTSGQMENALWPEYKKWANRLPEWLVPLIDIKSSRSELVHARAESFLTAATARPESPEALQGVHCTPGWVLLLGDEASGIDDRVYEAGAGSMSGKNAMTILAGNPTRGQGFFFDTQTKLADDGTHQHGMWKIMCVPCSESPAADYERYEADIARRYGRDSNAYRIRVLGEFPVSDDDTVVPFDLVEAAKARDIVIGKTDPVIWGVDPARFGSDRSVLCKRQSRSILETPRAWVKLDTMELASRIKMEWDESPQWLRPVEICVDAIGIGAGVADRLHELGLPVRSVNVSESPSSTNADRYSKLRDDLWFRAREWFAGRDVVIPATGCEELIEELTTVKYRFLPGSTKIKVESKDEMKKRGRRSPDLADAFILTLASDAMTLAGAKRTSWSVPIHRPLKSVV